MLTLSEGPQPPTITNLVEFVHLVNQTCCDNSQLHVIYTDFSKAFDQVKYFILIRKLFIIELHSSLLSWIAYVHQLH